MRKGICMRFPVCEHTQPQTEYQESNQEETIVVFDFETTGVSAKKNKIIEIGALKARGSQVLEEFSELIHPREYISSTITQITGITNRDLHGKPYENEVMPRFMRMLQDADVIIAHNLPFDSRFLKETCRRLGLTPYRGKGLCTLKYAKQVAPNLQSYKLGDLCQYYQIPLTNAHRAIYDVRATFQLFLHLKGLNHQIVDFVSIDDFK